MTQTNVKVLQQDSLVPMVASPLVISKRRLTLELDGPVRVKEGWTQTSKSFGVLIRDLANDAEFINVILNFEVDSSSLVYVYKERVLFNVPFQSILCVQQNIVHKAMFTVYLNSGLMLPIDHFFENSKCAHELVELMQRCILYRIKEFKEPNRICSTVAKKKGTMVWSERHLVLTSSFLFCFRTDDESNYPLNAIVLIGDIIVDSPANQPYISLKLPSRKYEFEFATMEEKKNWSGLIMEIVSRQRIEPNSCPFTADEFIEPIANADDLRKFSLISTAPVNVLPIQFSRNGSIMTTSTDLEIKTRADIAPDLGFLGSDSVSRPVLPPRNKLTVIAGPRYDSVKFAMPSGDHNNYGRSASHKSKKPGPPLPPRRYSVVSIGKGDDKQPISINPEEIEDTTAYRPISTSCLERRVKMEGLPLLTDLETESHPPPKSADAARAKTVFFADIPNKSPLAPPLHSQNAKRIFNFGAKSLSSINTKGMLSPASLRNVDPNVLSPVIDSDLENLENDLNGINFSKSESFYHSSFVNIIVYDLTLTLVRGVARKEKFEIIDLSDASPILAESNTLVLGSLDVNGRAKSKFSLKHIRLRIDQELDQVPENYYFVVNGNLVDISKELVLTITDSVTICPVDDRLLNTEAELKVFNGAVSPESSEFEDSIQVPPPPLPANDSTCSIADVKAAVAPHRDAPPLPRLSSAASSSCISFPIAPSVAIPKNASSLLSNQEMNLAPNLPPPPVPVSSRVAAKSIVQPPPPLSGRLSTVQPPPPIGSRLSTVQPPTSSSSQLLKTGVSAPLGNAPPPPGRIPSRSVISKVNQALASHISDSASGAIPAKASFAPVVAQLSVSVKPHMPQMLCIILESSKTAIAYISIATSSTISDVRYLLETSALSNSVLPKDFIFSKETPIGKLHESRILASSHFPLLFVRERPQKSDALVRTVNEDEDGFLLNAPKQARVTKTISEFPPVSAPPPPPPPPPPTDPHPLDRDSKNAGVIAPATGFAAFRLDIQCCLPGKVFSLGFLLLQDATPTLDIIRNRIVDELDQALFPTTDFLFLSNGAPISKKQEMLFIVAPFLPLLSLQPLGSPRGAYSAPPLSPVANAMKPEILTVVLVSSSYDLPVPLGQVEVLKPNLVALSDIRMMIINELDNTPIDFYFLVNKLPVGVRQEGKRFVSNLPPGPLYIVATEIDRRVQRSNSPSSPRMATARRLSSTTKRLEEQMTLRGQTALNSLKRASNMIPAPNTKRSIVMGNETVSYKRRTHSIAEMDYEVFLPPPPPPPIDD